MERGQVWWTAGDDEWPVVLLSADLQAVQIVAPATEAQKRGFIVLSPAEAEDEQRRTRPAGIGGVGIEVPLGADEGLPRPGVVRVALPQHDRIFCTWLLEVSPEALIEQAGSLSPGKLRQLDMALRLAAGDGQDPAPV